MDDYMKKTLWVLQRRRDALNSTFRAVTHPPTLSAPAGDPDPQQLRNEWEDAMRKMNAPGSIMLSVFWRREGIALLYCARRRHSLALRTRHNNIVRGHQYS